VTAQVHPDHVVPLLVGEVEQHPVARHPGVVDHDVELAEALDRRGEHGVRGGPLPHVALDDRDLGAEPLELVRRLVGRARQVVEHDAGTRPAERERLGPAEAGSGTGDDRDPAVQ
jgi:hypothetical protein